MRQRIREILTTMGLGMVLTAAMAGLAWAQPVSQQYSRLSVVAVEGENAWIAKSGREEEKAAVGVPLVQGQLLRTGESTSMYLNADGDKIIQLGSTTRAVVTEATDKKLRITLEEGFLFFDVKRKLVEGEELYFDTAHASMNVRGTSGLVITIPGDLGANNGGTVAQLLTGAVEYTSGGQTGTLTPGNTLVISSDARPGQTGLIVQTIGSGGDRPDSDELDDIMDAEFNRGQTGTLVAGDDLVISPSAQSGRKEPYAFENAGDEIRPRTLEDVKRKLFPWRYVTHAPEGSSENLEAVAREGSLLTLGYRDDIERLSGEGWDLENPYTNWDVFSERKAELEAKAVSQYGKPVVESSEEQDAAYVAPAGGTAVLPDGPRPAS